MDLDLTPEQRDSMLYLRHGFRTQPHFVAFWVNELPAPAPWIARNVFGCPLLTWTVRTPEQRARAARYGLDRLIQRRSFAVFPWITFTLNIVSNRFVRRYREVYE